MKPVLVDRSSILVSLNPNKIETFSTLLQKHCNKKQETKECILKLCGYIYHQGTYTPQVSDRLRAGTEKGAGFLPFTGI